MTSKYLIPLLTSVITTCSIYPALGQEITASEITFTCENNNDTPITLVKDRKGQTKTVFYWKKEVLAGKTRFTVEELCNNVSEKLNSSVQEDLYLFDLHATEEYGLPIICITADSGCSSFLFSLAPSYDESATKTAIKTLEAILNSNIIIEQRDPCKNRDCPVSMLYTINLFQNQ